MSTCLTATFQTSSAYALLVLQQYFESPGCACSYSGGRTKDAFLEFIDNKLTEDSGFARVGVLDELAAKFTSATDTSDLIKQAQDLAASLTDDAKVNGDVYLKSMQKAASKASLLDPGWLGVEAMK